MRASSAGVSQQSSQIKKEKKIKYFFLDIQIFLPYFPESVIGIKVEAQAA